MLGHSRASVSYRIDQQPVLVVVLDKASRSAQTRWARTDHQHTDLQSIDAYLPISTQYAKRIAVSRQKEVVLLQNQSILTFSTDIEAEAV